jgi:predicted CXXCH cytochrome family protein
MRGLGKLGNIKLRHLGLGLLIAAGILWRIPLVAPALADTADASDSARADIIVIDDLKTFGPLERPAVQFEHDKHTDVLSKQNKDCLTCHKMVSDRMDLRFGRTDDKDKQTVMGIYHDRCISCHKENSDAGKPSGPVTCGQCHVEDAVLQADRTPIQMDKSLHYRHVKATGQKCERCHHEYNAQTKTLFYAKGQEGACLYCHKDHTEENRISYQAAAHQACVGCHREKAARQEYAGPIQCSGCHDPKQQALIANLTDIPRLDRNQPDTVLVRTMPKDGGSVDPVVHMGAVPFDHKAHEGYNATCKVCHHADMQSCADCHSIEGRREGRQVKLVQAMHQPDAAMSCIGCHERQKQQPQCIGCHHSIPRDRTLTSSSACLTCHMTTATETSADLVTSDSGRMDSSRTDAGRPDSGRPDSGRMDSARSAALAAKLLAARQPVRHTVAADQIPETVTIKTLVDQYKQVVMPHRKMVLALAQVNQTNNLAAYFHSNPLTLCQGCHHNSPASLTPPRCDSCHGHSSEALNPTRPGLLAAFHQQCIECHETMGLKKPVSRECTACHAKRN